MLTITGNRTLAAALAAHGIGYFRDETTSNYRKNVLFSIDTGDVIGRADVWEGWQLVKMLEA